ncbi:replication initiation factor domain-containing protein [Gimesia fumaroli]|uniref:Replication initiation factor n=1 Tax=Gimesia fumaroli TaxID=2527976 RepID=A0A518IC71_9PLAN|nr:replication initiation factor domain-containing protein [Gimesia fumaroli]QDV50697.1 Replication initiation factor [Gimesia fumaroli]
MDDSQSCAFGKDPSGNNHTDSPEEIGKTDQFPENTLESERGAGGSDEASDSKVRPGMNRHPALPENQGVESSNTTPSNHHCPSLSPVDTLSAGGLDWLSLSFYGSFDDSYWEQIRYHFSFAQQHAIENDHMNCFVKLPSEIMLKVEASGKGRGQSYCKWKFKYQGITFGIRDCQSSLVKDGQPPNIFIDIPSLPLLTYGESEILKLIYLVLDFLGYSIERVTPSRADLCVDLVDTSMSVIDEAVEKRCYVSRSRKFNKYLNNHVVETIRFGCPGSKTSVRIYNKFIECRNDIVKSQLLKDFRWGKKPDHELGAIRVEFQVMRDHLRDQHSIITYDDLITKRKSLARWLTHDWLRFTDKEPQPGHSDRVGPSVLWQKVIDAFDSWTGKGVEERSKRIVSGADITRLIYQIKGCVTSAIATTGKIPITYFELEKSIMDLLTPHYPLMIDDIRKKRKILEANHPYLVTDLTSSN